MKKTFFKFLSVLLCSIVLAGCGFTLRSAQTLPPRLQRIYYKTDNPYNHFEVAFKKLLKASKVSFVDLPDKTALTLYVTSSYHHETTSPDSSTQARIYTLNYAATVSIIDFAGKTLVAPQVVTYTRSIALQPNEVFEVTPQIETVEHEMQQELAIKLLNVLSSKNVMQNLTETPYI